MALKERFIEPFLSYFGHQIGFAVDSTSVMVQLIYLKFDTTKAEGIVNNFVKIISSQSEI